MSSNLIDSFVNRRVWVSKTIECYIQNRNPAQV